MQITGDLKPISSGPVDPTATFSDANYEIGGTLDLASKFTSNSEGAVTYTVKDAGTTGATIAGSNFTATAVGTAIVTASQAAVADKYNAKSWDATITVTAPVAKYAVNFAAGEGTGTMDAIEYAAGAEVTLPECTFTAPAGKVFDAWTSSDVTITDGPFTMPANAVTVTATWKDLPVIDYLIKIEPTSKTAFTITGSVGGTGAVATLGGPDANGGYKLNGEGAYMAFKLASGYFEPGDKVIAYCTTAQSKKFTVSTGTTEASVIGSTSGNWQLGENVYVLPETLGENVNTLYVARIGSSGTYAQNPNILWIKVVRPAKHDVIFAAGDGTGSMETKQVAEGANYTIPNCTFTAPTGKEFDAWTSSDVTITDGKFTMPASNVTLTATWKTSVTKYTVTYMDGAVELGSEQVVAGEKAASVPAPTKELNTFAGWEDAEHNAIDFATKTIDADLTVYAKWTAFGEATSINIEQFVIDNGKSGDIQAALTDANFDFNLVSGDELDDLITDGTKNDNNCAFRGLKLKHDGSFVVGNIPAGKRVDVVIGNLGAAKVQINGVDAATALVAGVGTSDKTTAAGYKNAHNYYDLPEGGVLKVLSTGTSTTVLKGILIADIPAVSDDATLSDLTLDGVTIDGFTSSKQLYDVKLPYGASIPVVAAVANHANASVGAITQATVEVPTASFWVTAEDGTNKLPYQVRFTWAPKQGVSIIKATHTGATTASVEGMIGGSIDKYTQGAGKLGSPDHYFGIKLAEGTFLAGDVLTISATAASAIVQIFSDKGTTMLNEGVFVNNVYTFTLEAATEWIYLYRTSASGSNMNPTLGYMEVQRSMAPVITSFVIGEAEGVIDQENKTIAVEVANDADLAALTAPVITAVGNGGAAVVTPAAQTDFSAPVVFTATDAYGELSTNYTVTVTKAAAPAATPTITTQPASHDYLDTEVIAALTVEATVSDAGVLSYQWYKGEDAIAEATAASYTPTEAGSYKVVVTNTLGEETAEATSDVAVINITHIYTFDAWDGTSTTFTKTGEWTLYPYNKDNRWVISDQKFKAEQVVSATDATAKANVFTDQYFLVNFAKDMQEVLVKVYYSGSDRTINDIYTVETLGDASTSTKGSSAVSVKDDYTIDAQGRDAAKVSTTTITGLFETGVNYVFKVSGTSGMMFEFIATAATEKSADPAVATLVAETVCSDGTFATLDAVTAAESTYSYQWYKDDAEFATTQTINPTDGGVYYCKVTNSETDKRAVTKETNKVTLVRLTSGTTVSVEDGLAKTGETVELTATAAGAGTLTYAWYTCDDAEGTNPVVIGGETNATYTATVGAATAYYMVEVTADCGTASAVATVNVKPETYELQDVTGNMTWDFTNKAAADGDKAVADADKGSYVVLANTEIKSTFANAEYMAANYNKYTAKAIQATGLKIHTTVPGFVIVTFAQTGGDKVRELYINGEATGATPSGTTNMTYTQYVEAGEVVLTSWEASTSKWQMFNYAKIEFVTELADSKFESVRTLSSSNIGTICLQKGVAAFKGATFYEIAYVEMQAGEPYKVFFDEVEKLEAGHAYIFEPEEDATEILVAYDGVTAAAPVAVNGLHGTFEAIAASEDNVLVGNYIVNSNQIRKCGINCSLGANRAYIKMNEVTGYPVAPAPGRRRISLGNQDSQVTTDIENLNGETMHGEPMKILINGQVFILRGAKMYNAQGQLVK